MKYLRFLVLGLVIFLVIGFTHACTGSIEEVGTAEKTVKEEAEEEKEFIINIPSLIGKDAYQIKESLGEPTIYNEPYTDEELGEVFGTLSWNIEIEDTGNVLMFGYDYYSDGSIADDVFVFTAFKEEGKSLMRYDVLEWGNLEAFSDNYNIETKKNTVDIMELWISPGR